MSEIKQMLDKILSEISEEKRSAVAPLIKEIEREYDDKNADVKAAVAESMKRKEKIREMTSQIESLEAEKNELSKKADTSQYEQELEELRQYKQTVFEQQKSSFNTWFDKVSNHPNFEKAKTKFKLPEVSEDGKLNLESLDDDALNHNIKVMKDLQDLDYFGQPQPRMNGNRFDDTPRDSKPEIKNRSDWRNYVKEQLDNSI